MSKEYEPNYNTKRRLPNNEDFLPSLAEANGLSAKNPVATIADTRQTINDNLILEGTTNASTSQAIYGVNIITTSTVADLATRLPDGVTGKQTVFINNSILPIKVFPAYVGGKINGVVDGVAVIPNDGRAYTFYCTENPIPLDAWSWDAATATGILAYGEGANLIEISHTNGADTFRFNAGQGTANDVTVGGGYGGGILLSGTWNSLSFSATMTRIKCYTNITAADIASAAIKTTFMQLFQNAPTGVTSGVRVLLNFSTSNTDVQTITAGTAYTGEIGDIGTLYLDSPFTPADPFSSIIGNQCETTPLTGTSQDFLSKAFFTFGMEAYAPSPTKTYKFAFFLEYF